MFSKFALNDATYVRFFCNFYLEILQKVNVHFRSISRICVYKIPGETVLDDALNLYKQFDVIYARTKSAVYKTKSAIV